MVEGVATDVKRGGLSSQFAHESMNCGLVLGGRVEEKYQYLVFRTNKQLAKR